MKTPSAVEYTQSEVDGFGDGKVPLVFVMLVRRESVNPERVGVGYVYEDFWNAANPVMKETMVI